MSGKPILYYFNGSSPVRSVYLVAAALNLDLDRRFVDLFKRENLTPEFLKLNPQHTVPVLVDNGQSLWDSHAIITYLIRKFGGEDHPLYPTDCYTRARIDQRLHFNNGVLYRTIVEIYFPFYLEGGYDISEKSIKNSNEAYGFLETFLTTDKYLVGDHLTVADLSAITSVTQMMYMVPIDENKYPKLTAWIKGFDELSYFHEENTVHRLEFMKFVDGLRDENCVAANNA